MTTTLADLGRHFTAQDVCTACGISRAALHNWQKAGLILQAQPSAAGAWRRYSVFETILVKAAVLLRKLGFESSRIVSLVHWLQLTKWPTNATLLHLHDHLPGALVSVDFAVLANQVFDALDLSLPGTDDGRTSEVEVGAAAAGEAAVSPTEVPADEPADEPTGGLAGELAEGQAQPEATNPPV